MALYRKYRPASFAEVVGQEHVTTPLSRALDSGRINHAYLFSGPRGCGKTSSARIMARSLNCEEGPTSTPCGRCPSCISLAPGGSGNLDVTELDAASHRGVEDMRELRDRAYYAPAESRYRVFIIDEAHMITTEGSNALLKIVEEPPEHLIFIFATTEPEKVINTIRSRTHHYPFRLLTPQAMRGLLQRTVDAESALVEDSVYPLVIRAGGGSPRDSLSILDQLLAGAGKEGLTYEQAVALLGVTNDALLDATITALASSDYASLFGTIDDVIEGGFEPRQFALDLLNRLRDLMVIRTVNGAVEHGLVDAPTGRESVLTEQAHSFSPAQLARMAALTNDGLTDMRGATSARLLLEVMCAKLLLPAEGSGAPSGASGASGAAAPTAAAGTEGATRREGTPPRQNRDTAAATAPPRFERKSVRLKREQEEAARRKAEEQRQAEEQREAENQREAEEFRQSEDHQAAARDEAVTPPSEQPPAQGDTAHGETGQRTDEPRTQQSTVPETRIADAWNDIRVEISKASSRTGVMVAQAQVLEESADSVTLGHNTGALASRLSSDEHRTVIATAIHEVTGKTVDVSCVIGGTVRRQGRDRAAHASAAQGNQQGTQHEDSDPEPGRAPGGEASKREEAEPKPAETQTAEPKPAETQTAEPKPAETQTAEPKPAEPKEASEEKASRWSGWQAPQLPPEPETSAPALKRTQAQRPPRTFERPRRSTENRRGLQGQRGGYPTPDEVPLPPEPAPEDVAPDTEFPPYPPDDLPTASAPTAEPQSQSQEEIEEDFVRQAAESSGEVDRRDQKTVAIELLQEQLGAKLL